ncbi:MAG: phosphoribosylamine--glycine ligase [Candidatus Pacebacteria bacterium]|nr:phosphoribosylamine--glycine ligase [Candidatus Paceibacterota bacterium]
MKRNILVIGSGGREHAIVWKLSQSFQAGEIYVAPENGETHRLATNISINVDETNCLVNFAKENKIDITIVGPDDSLADGIVDAFQKNGLKIFGPNRYTAQIESSKSFAKKMMIEESILTAQFEIFSDHQKALDYVIKQGVPIVIKASGLALGKGVYICKTIEEAETALREIMLDRKYGDAGNEIIIEEYFEGGQEISVHAFSDGITTKLFPMTQDHKPIFAGNQGPNTGGMGIVPMLLSSEMITGIQRQVVDPIINAFQRKGESFVGVLYPGLMITSNGIRVLEYNARFGDPETQYYMRLLKTDLVDIIEACIEERLSEIEIEWNPIPCVCVIVSSNGYPGEYKTGFPICGINEAERVPGVVIFHAGTSYEDGKLKTSGGRVLGITAIGETVEIALSRAYEAINLISFDGMYYREDIGFQITKRES